MKNLKRASPSRKIRKVFHLFCEGNTEKAYFEILRRINSNKVTLKLHHANGKTTADQMLRKIKQFIANEKLETSAHLWLIIDVDHNSREALEAIKSWEKTHRNYGLALSNPKFEYWIILHFCDGKGINTSNLDKELEKFYPQFNKSNLSDRTLGDKILAAIKNAKLKHQYCEDWFTDLHTTVYCLVEKIMAD